MGLLLLLALPGVSAAQGISVDRYTAPPSPNDLLWLERADPGGGHLRPFGRLTVGYADDPLILVIDGNEANQVRLVDHQLGIYASAGLILWDRVQAALVAPAYFQSGPDFTSAGHGFSPDGAAFGNPGLDLRFVGLDRKAPVELALAATLRAPLGPSDKLVADDGVSVAPRILLSRHLGDQGSFIGVSLGTLLRRSVTLGNVEPGSDLTFTAGGLLAFTRSVGATLELAGDSGFNDLFSAKQTPLEGTVGLRFSHGPFVAGAGVGAGLTDGIGTPDIRALATLGLIATKPKPRPTQPAPPLPAVNPDRDGDGIPNDRDQCPDKAEDKDGFQDDDGCPDTDNDNDGILDAKDKCPDQAEDKDGFQDDDGCPDTDNDNDGVKDESDKCPDKAEDTDGWQDDDGCPDTDNDHDGIVDAKDKCPNEPETKNGKDDEDGCPDLVRVKKGRIVTLQPIHFEYNKAKIQSRSEPLLIEMAKVIQARADIGHVSIEGYTDSRGTPAYNQKLSERRAQAVMKFLVDAGVSAQRLSAKGFGEKHPIADNKTAAGRAKNRRVEFHFKEPSANPDRGAAP